MTTVLYSDGVRYADSQLTSSYDTLVSNTFPKVKVTTNVGLGHEHHCRSKILDYPYYRVSFAGNMHTIDILLHELHEASDPDKVMTAFCNALSAKAASFGGKRPTKNDYSRFMILCKKTNNLLGFTIKVDCFLQQILLLPFYFDANTNSGADINRHFLDKTTCHSMGSGSDYQEVRDLLADNKPEEALKLACSMDFFSGGKCMDTKVGSEVYASVKQDITDLHQAATTYPNLEARDVASEKIYPQGEPQPTFSVAL